MSRRIRKKIYSIEDLKILYGMRFGPIKEYLIHSEELISRLEHDLEIEIKKWDKKHRSNPEIPNGFYVHENEVLIKGEFRKILYHSILLTAYSLFETEFKDLCDYAAKIQGSKPPDLSRGNYIVNCRRFIVTILKVNLNKLNSEWVEIKNFRLIRNSIAHNNGIKSKNATSYILTDCVSCLSGWQDSNLRPPAPKAGALTGLRYTPKMPSS
jgi:hypothetical protein